ncbi:uncharacterized protein LOC125230458 isoform X2 [Leguminivora glycinivorella]|uniref:uncharacterized protein LOC125230458 isoform X2 n=1 Tax=Leguminivora glycinivorella TaxID=1035111 RepID=UPI0020106705|nr:uncharacterized protein LOC125230458 isoform X2 [Leguminivora glycinivorella]
MADQEEDRLKNAETIVVVDRQTSAESKSRTSSKDGPNDGIHKRPRVPDIPMHKDVFNQHAAGMPSSTTSHTPTMKQYETIELAKIEQGTKQTSTKKDDLNKKRLETTFPAETGSEPTASVSVTKRFESTPPRKEVEPTASETVRHVKTKEAEHMQSEMVKKAKQSHPIPDEVKPSVTKPSLRARAGEEAPDEDTTAGDTLTRISDWMTDIDLTKKSELSWDDPEYLDKVQLQILSDFPTTSKADEPCVSTVEPHVACDKPPRGMLNQKPCGIALCLPQKSSTPLNGTAKTGIHIEICKGSVLGSRSQFTVSEVEDMDDVKIPAARSAEQFPTTPRCFSLIREKLDILLLQIIDYFK